MKRILRATAAGPLLLLAAPARAAEGGSASDFWFQLINLLILVGVLVYALRKAVPAFFSERREGIRNELDSAQEVLQQAETRHAEWQRKLADLDTELDSIRSTARQRAEEESDRILADARAQADRIRADAVTAVEQEARRVRDELRSEAADLVTELAGQLLAENVGDEDRDRLLTEFVQSVEASSPAGNRS